MPVNVPSKCVSISSISCSRRNTCTKAEQKIERKENSEDTYGGAHAPFVLPASAITYSRHSSSAFVSRRNSSLMFVPFVGAVIAWSHDRIPHDARRLNAVRGQRTPQSTAGNKFKSIECAHTKVNSPSFADAGQHLWKSWILGRKRT